MDHGIKHGSSHLILFETKPPLEGVDKREVTINARISAQLQMSAPLRISAPPKAPNL